MTFPRLLIAFALLIAASVEAVALIGSTL